MNTVLPLLLFTLLSMCYGLSSSKKKRNTIWSRQIKGSQIIKIIKKCQIYKKMIIWVTTDVYFWVLRRGQLWLGVVYSASLLDDYYNIKIDRFKNTDKNRLNRFETILQYNAKFTEKLPLSKKQILRIQKRFKCLLIFYFLAMYF